jgi:serine/threonine protein kinase
MRNNYQILEEIGSGEFGEVYKCQYVENMDENKI